MGTVHITVMPVIVMLGILVMLVIQVIFTDLNIINIKS
jgi:hypothetical protein